MSYDTAADYIQRKGWKVHSKGPKGWLTDCPACGHCKCLNIHPGEHGQFVCMSCGDSGNLLTLKRSQGDVLEVSTPAAPVRRPPTTEHDEDRQRMAAAHKRLMAQHDDTARRAWQYLTEDRGFTEETITEFRLGVETGRQPFITIPYVLDSKVVGAKMRSYPPQEKTFRRIQDRTPGMFNVSRGLEAAKEWGAVIICEGELDAISWHQYGFRAVVSLPDGSKSWDGEWAALFDDVPDILLSMDADEPGQQAAKELAQRLGTYRCRFVTLPESAKDANECLTAAVPLDSMTDALHRAEGARNEYIRRLDHYTEALIAKVENREVSTGLRTGWRDLDEIWGGVRMGELTILTGDTGSGKTTFATDFIRRQSEAAPVLIAEFENSPDDVLAAMVSQEASQHYLALASDDIRATALTISERGVYVLDHRGAMGLDVMRDTLLYARQRYGVRTFVIDHLHYFLTLDGKNDVAIIRDAAQKISDWAHEWNVHIMLIAHPRQLESDNTKVQMFQIKGGSDLKQIADSVMSIWRRRTVDREGHSLVKLTILKCRSRAGGEGSISLAFLKNYERYEDHDDKHEQEAQAWDTPRR